MFVNSVFLASPVTNNTEVCLTLPHFPHPWCKQIEALEYYRVKDTLSDIRGSVKFKLTSGLKYKSS